ncbi:MAG TPA: hypothetical protein VD999_03320 [Vitreimonas sp.]|nr:hypothetical protein [Vitreimonas sp.]
MPSDYSPACQTFSSQRSALTETINALSIELSDTITHPDETKLNELKKRLANLQLEFATFEAEWVDQHLQLFATFLKLENPALTQNEIQSLTFKLRYDKDRHHFYLGGIINGAGYGIKHLPHIIKEIRGQFVVHPEMTSLNEVEECTFINLEHHTNNLEAPKLRKVSEIVDNKSPSQPHTTNKLRTLSFPALTEADKIHLNDNFVLNVPVLKRLDHPLLYTSQPLHFPELIEMTYAAFGAPEVHLPKCVIIKDQLSLGHYGSVTISVFNAPELRESGVINAVEIKSLYLPELVHITGGLMIGEIDDFNLPKLETIEDTLNFQYFKNYRFRFSDRLRQKHTEVIIKTFFEKLPSLKAVSGKHGVCVKAPNKEVMVKLKEEFDKRGISYQGKFES